LHRRVNSIFIRPGNSGPRKLCDVCKVYFTWWGGKFRCPSCGSKGTADEVIESTRKVLKADVAIPRIAGKKKKVVAYSDLPRGAQIISEHDGQS
jgi:hypothetical protein